MNTLTLIIIVVLATIAIMGAALALGKSRSNNPGEKIDIVFIDAWDKIRPIISELFINLFSVYQADKLGYDGLVDFSVDYIYIRVQQCDFLFEDEKKLFTRDVIKALLEPKLRELYEQKKIS